MTREDVIRMAREAGIITNSPYLMPHDHVMQGIERFAQLVADYVRSPEWLARRTNAAIAAEREACALMVMPLDESLADAIRARGQQ